jgi:hypothetical protein
MHLDILSNNFTFSGTLKDIYFTCCWIFNLYRATKVALGLHIRCFLGMQHGIGQAEQVNMTMHSCGPYKNYRPSRR